MCAACCLVSACLVRRYAVRGVMHELRAVPRVALPLRLRRVGIWAARDSCCRDAVAEMPVAEMPVAPTTLPLHTRPHKHQRLHTRRGNC